MAASHSVLLQYSQISAKTACLFEIDVFAFKAAINK